MKRKIMVIFGVVEAAGSNPVTQTNANCIRKRKASYFSGWLAFLYQHIININVDDYQIADAVLRCLLSALDGAFFVFRTKRIFVRRIRCYECPCYVICH